MDDWFSQLPGDIQEAIVRLYNLLPDKLKESIIRFVVEHKPAGRKLKDIMGHGRETPTFDLDIVDGNLGEWAMLKVATDDKHEVKRDFVVSRSGQVAIEVSCNSRGSGLTTTEALFWTIWLSGEEYQDEVAITIATPRLRKIVKAFSFGVRGGDEGRARVQLVKVEKLLSPLSEIDAELRQPSFF